MVSHKKSIIRIILLTLLIITIFNSFQISNVSAQTSYNYNFSKNIYYNQDNPTANFTYNVRNQTQFTNIYNGTCSFTDDADGSNPNGWIRDETGGYVNVSASVDNHDKVLTFNDISAVAGIEGETTGIYGFNEVSGTIEFWFYTDDATLTVYFVLMMITDTLIYLYTLNDKWYINDGGAVDTGEVCLDDTWYHIRIDYECEGGSYLGLAPDTYHLTINTEYIDTYGFHTNGGMADRLFITTSTSHSNWNAHFDAFGYSWDTDYSIGDNIIPYHYLNNTQEVNAYEFFNNVNGSLTVNNQQAIPYWNKLDTIGYITKNQDIFDDETAVYFPIGDVDHEGLERTFDVATSRIIRINFTVAWGTRLGSEKCFTYFDIDSYDDTLIVRLRMDDNTAQGDLRLSYWDGGAFVEIEDLVNVFGILNLNITIHNEIVIVDTDDGNYIFPILSIGKAGLGDVKIETYASAFFPANFGLFVDSIGVYIDGISESTDYSNHYYNIGTTFNNKYHNLIYLNATGYFGLGITNFEMSVGTYTFFPYHNVSDTTFLNCYFEGSSSIISSYINLITNTSFNINSISIEGVEISTGIIPTYTSNSVNNTHESYFYVDSGNRLRYRLFINDNNSEYIQASFNVPDLLTENYSVSFLSNIDGSSYGFFRVMYTDDTSTFIPFPTWLSTSNVILPQTRKIDNLAILITDNDNNDNDYTYGYITNLRLIYITDISVSIITLNLMMVIVPIMVLLVPTFGISARYGKSTIIPVFILMSIICFATGLIPTWLFFVIMLSAGAFLFMKRKIEAD